jgi:hypothetical protein
MFRKAFVVCMGQLEKERRHYAKVYAIISKWNILGEFVMWSLGRMIGLLHRKRFSEG